MVAKQMLWCCAMNQHASTCVACQIINSLRLEELRDTALILARVVNPDVKVVGVSVNTQHLSDDEATTYLSDVEVRMGIPAVDPFRHGAGRLVDALEAC